MSLPAYLVKYREILGHEPILIPSVTVLIRDQYQRILMARSRDSGLWVAPGGMVDPGENPASAAVREAWEETGLFVELTGILGVFGGPDCRVTYPNGDVADFVSTFFSARILSGQLHPQDEEIDELRFVAPSEIGGLNLAHWARVFLPPILAGEGHRVSLQSSWRPPRAGQ